VSPEPAARSSARSTYVKFNDAQAMGIEAYARDLGLPMIAVTSALVSFGLAVRAGIPLDTFSDELRQMMGDPGEGRIIACEFTDEQWMPRRLVYEKFCELGLIEGLRAKPSLNYADRWIVAFNVSDAGRVLADLFKQAELGESIAGKIA
jgi:hypothetical protein